MNNTHTPDFLFECPDSDARAKDNIVYVDTDRYGGSYSGYVYTAWLNSVPEDVDAGDFYCGVFWDKNKIIFGGGNTPDEAVKDLFDKLYVRPKDDENYMAPELPLLIILQDDLDNGKYKDEFDNWRKRSVTMIVVSDMGRGDKKGKAGPWVDVFKKIYPLTCELLEKNLHYVPH